MQFKPPYRPNEPEWQQQPNIQQLPLQNGHTFLHRLKRNPVFWWANGGIVCIILAVVGYVLLSSHSFSPWSTTVVPQYPALHATYKGTYTESSPIATTSPMVLAITSDDHQGHISGRLAILVLVGDGDPFTGTLGTNGTITFTATPLLISVRTVFTGMVNHDGSISGTTENYVYEPASWKLSPA